MRYSEAIAIKAGDILDDKRVTWVHRDYCTGVGMGEGPDYVYIVTEDGSVWSAGSWAEVSKLKRIAQ